MQRYWVIAPYDSAFPEIWERVWQFDLQNGLISIGWRELGDFSALGQDSLRAAIDRTYTNAAPQGRTLMLNMLWSFYHNIQPGDIVVARRGRKRIAGVGDVVGRAYYSANKNAEATGPGREYNNHINIQWHESPRDKDFSNMVFGMQTLLEIGEDKFKTLLEDKGSEKVHVTEVIENPVEFTLEKYLEEFIVTNFNTIFHDKLVLYQDPLSGNEVARQYETEVGTIDILAQEPSTNSFVVIELKKGHESDKVVGQTLRYMGWVGEKLCTEGQTVKGIVICKDADTKLSYALKMTASISVKYYKVDFKLFDTPDHLV